MADNKNCPRIPDQHIIPQLESLLSKTMGDNLVLVEYTATNLLPPGENYGSLILQVDAKIRIDQETKDLNLIAKIPPPTQQQRDFFDSPFTFKKESFMYETILPTYRKFEQDCGITDQDLFDIGPTFYGSRLSLLSGEVFDDDAVILMENLKIRGYYLGDRYQGLDYQHSKRAVSAMARFHALGIAIKQKKPDFFEILKVRSKCLEMKNPDEWKDAMEEMYKNIKEDPVLFEHYDKCLAAFEAGRGSDCWLAPPIEPWSTIIHADFWINNIMFRRDDADDIPIDVKFVDFQNYLFLSPTRELAFFIAGGVNGDIGVADTNKLIDHYYDEFIKRLESMGCDVTSYDREGFNAQLVKDAYIEFTHTAFMLKIMTKHVEDIDDVESRNVANVMMNSGSEMFHVRMRDLVKGYLERGWM